MKKLRFFIGLLTFAVFIGCFTFKHSSYTNAHAAAKLNSGYSKYAKVARVHYYCTIALWTPCAVLTRAWASRRVGLRECRTDSFSTQIITFCWYYFNDFLNLLKRLIYYTIKDKKLCLRRVWIRLTTAYLLCSRELWQNNALALQFWCLSNVLTLRVRALDLYQNLSKRALFCHSSLAKVNTQLLIYNYSLFARSAICG